MASANKPTTCATKKQILFVPGLSSPYNPHYLPLYESLMSEAVTYGYERSEIILFPGQRAADGTQVGLLTMSAAVERLEQTITNLVKDEDLTLRILAFSFGCTVALSAAAKSIGCRINDMVLWGPVPFWQSWKAFRRGIGRTRLGSSTEIAPDHLFFETLEPVEYLLPLSKSKVRLARGTDDEYCTDSYLSCLGDLSTRNQPCVEFRTIAACAHTPFPSQKGWSAFLETVLA